MRRALTPYFFVLILAMLVSACSQEAPPTNAVEEIVATQVAGTVAAVSSQMADLQTKTASTPIPTATKEPTPNPTAQATTTAAGKPTVSGCLNSLEFVGDITIPDGVSIPPGTKFKKTWAVRNTGGCFWDSSYAVVFYSGDLMGAPSSMPLMSSGSVKPGDLALISVEMVAPTELRTYTGFWRLKDPQGNIFGYGPAGDRSFYVQIKVANEYNFVQNLCSASWRNGSDLLYCPGKENDPKGSYYVIQNPKLENGFVRDAPTLIMVPQTITDGEISARFNPIVVPDGGNFKTVVGCLYGETFCKANITVSYTLDGSVEETIGEWNEFYDGLTTEVGINLGALGLSGKPVTFILRVRASGGPEGDKIFWINPRIEP